MEAELNLTGCHCSMYVKVNTSTTDKAPAPGHIHRRASIVTATNTFITVHSSQAIAPKASASSPNCLAIHASEREPFSVHAAQ
jgi:hypothetical protein